MIILLSQPQPNPPLCPHITSTPVSVTRTPHNCHQSLRPPYTCSPRPTPAQTPPVPRLIPAWHHPQSTPCLQLSCLCVRVASQSWPTIPSKGTKQKCWQEKQRGRFVYVCVRERERERERFMGATLQL